MDKVTIQAKIVGIAADLTMFEDASRITADARFAEDLGCDSLDLVEIVMGIEEEFEIEIADEQAEKIKTVGEAVALVERLLDLADRESSDAQDALAAQPHIEFQPVEQQDPWAMLDKTGNLAHFDNAQARDMATEFINGSPREGLFLAALVVAVLDMAATVGESVAAKGEAHEAIGDAIRNMAIADSKPFRLIGVSVEGQS